MNASVSKMSQKLPTRLVIELRSGRIREQPGCLLSGLLGQNPQQHQFLLVIRQHRQNLSEMPAQVLFAAQLLPEVPPQLQELLEQSSLHTMLEELHPIEQ